MKIFWILLLLLFLYPKELPAQTIAEKKASLLHASGSGDLSPVLQQRLKTANSELTAAYQAIQQLNNKALEFYDVGALEEEWKQLVDERNTFIARIAEIEEQWRLLASEGGGAEEYALWSQPDATIGQLVADYGAQEYIYIIPNEVAGIKLSIDSSLPIPRAAWGEMLELLLRENGIGVKQLNPFLKQLYLVSQDKSTILLITNRRQELALLPAASRIAFVLTPQPAEVRRIWLFLDKFVNPVTTTLQQVGRDIIIIGQRAEVEELLKLHDFALANRGDREFKVVPLGRVDAEEISNVLAAIFGQSEGKSKGAPPSQQFNRPAPVGEPPPKGGRPGSPPPPSSRGRPLLSSSSQDSGSNIGEENGLKVLILNKVVQALFLIGTREEIAKAEEIIRDVERRLGEARERVLWWYTVKYSQAEELAEVLSKIYSLMVTTGTGSLKESQKNEGDVTATATATATPTNNGDELGNLFAARVLEQNQFYAPGGDVINRRPLANREAETDQIVNDRDNFIVDLKTGTIVMVVETDLIPKIKELLRKIDVPKKMVQIEVLLFETTLERGTDVGLSLLRIGKNASQTRGTSLDFNGDSPINSFGDFLRPFFPELAGITQFMISRKKHSGIPAYDLIYRFLISQHNVQINASPSVVTVNQTAAKIDINEEISINTGTTISATAPSTLERKFERKQYGTTIEVKPTIHMPELRESYEDRTDYITLETDILFQTFATSLRDTDQPDVISRHLTNEVRVADGQTVIIGGLRRKVNDDSKFSIPYLGEIPGLGKLFSYTELRTREQEMFLFITPKIISDAVDDFERIRHEEMCRRPGDIPCFLCHLVAAREYERNKALQGTLRILFGPEPDRCVEAPPWREYDGR